MKRILAVLLPLLAMCLCAGGAWADAAGPGSCFGGGNEPEHHDASGDAKTAQRRVPSRSDTRRAGMGLVAAGFATSGWLFLRRREPKR